MSRVAACPFSSESRVQPFSLRVEEDVEQDRGRADPPEDAAGLAQVAGGQDLGARHPIRDFS